MFLVILTPIEDKPNTPDEGQDGATGHQFERTSIQSIKKTTCNLYLYRCPSV